MNFLIIKLMIIIAILYLGTLITNLNIYVSILVATVLIFLISIIRKRKTLKTQLKIADDIIKHKMMEKK